MEAERLYRNARRAFWVSLASVGLSVIALVISVVAVIAGVPA